jgi:4-hydroxy-tetrahydrodipicolinate reductase
MGRMLVKVIAEQPGLQLAAATGRPDSPSLGQDAGQLAGLQPIGVTVTSDLDRSFDADVIVDFTTPAATAWTVTQAAEREVPMVIGTTGLSTQERKAVDKAARKIPIVLSANMSLGVNVLFGLISQAAAALGDAYDVEIVETHHRHKRDSPSGTALAMADVLAHALGRDLARVGSYGRKGDVGARPAGEIGVHAVRGGDVVGDHSVYFLGLGERLEISHRASSRETFARGALRAAEWLVERDPGIYDMQDVLGLRR